MELETDACSICSCEARTSYTAGRDNKCTGISYRRQAKEDGKQLARSQASTKKRSAEGKPGELGTF